MMNIRKVLGSHAFLLAGLLLLTAAVFSNTAGNDFIRTGDEGAYVLSNLSIRALTPRSVLDIFSSAPAGMYSPLTIFTYALDYRLGAYNPRVYHLASVAWHLGNVALVYLFIFLLSKRKIAAALTAALFAVHPMHAQSVNWIAQRKDLVYSFFYLLSLSCYVRYLESRPLKKYLRLALAFFLLSLFAKPAAVTLPLLLLLLDHYRSRSLDRPAMLEKVPFFVLSALFAGIIFLPFVQANANLNYVPAYNTWERILAFCYSLAFYVYKLFAPVGLHYLHGWPVKVNGSFAWAYYLAPAAAAVCVAAPAWAAHRFPAQRKNIIFGCLFFLAAVSIVLQFRPFGPVIVADHYTYIPYIGLFFTVAMSLAALADGRSRLKSAAAAVGVILVIGLFSALTYRRNFDWKNDYTALTDTISKDPTVSFAYNNLGNAEQWRKDFSSALSHYNKAIELNPAMFEAYSNRGALRYTLRDLKGALADYNKAIELRPGYYMPFNNRGVLKADLADAAGAKKDYAKAIALNPCYPVVFYNMGNLRYFGGMKRDALNWYTKAIELDPFYSSAYYNRGVVKMELNDQKGALEDFDAAIKIAPDYRQALDNRLFLLKKFPALKPA